MSKRVKSLDEIRESRLLFDKNPPAFGYILITVVAVFLIVAVVWSIKTPKVYTIQAQGTVTNDESNYVMCSYTGEILDSNMEEGALVEAGDVLFTIKSTDYDLQQTQLEDNRKSYEEQISQYSLLIKSIKDDTNYFDETKADDGLYWSLFETYKSQVEQNKVDVSTYQAYGYTDTAEHVQNQLEQTHAIQDKVDEVAVAVEEIGNSMTLTLKALAEGKQDIEHLASEVEASVDNGTEVTEKLENLNQYMDEMNSIVELIGGITNQTSLLALNASIEAARAGEAGRGFSVVATEISGMATRTKEATIHITELISNVSNAIMEVVGVVSNMINGINEEKTGASNAEESFESIEDNTRAIQKNADTLSRSISELQNANKEIIDSIQTISAISQQVSAHAGETMQAEEENLNVMQDVSAIMQKLATLAAH